MLRHYAAALLAASMVLLAACSRPPGYLDQDEALLGVDHGFLGNNLRLYHAALWQPQGLGLRGPGYVVGVEELSPSAQGVAGRDGELGQGRRETHAITHVMRYAPGSAAADGSAQAEARCALYTRLNGHPLEDGGDPGRRFFERCDGKGTVRDDTTGPIYTDATATARLRESLVSDLNMARYSHILVVVMGWNTDQEGALKNFNSLVGHLAVEAAARAEAGDKAAAAFRPLFVGVTWPSQWAITEWSLVPDPVIRGLSFPFKRFDADEVGRFALRHVVTDAVLPARDAGRGSPPVVLLGHSFGARALITALAGHPFRPGEDERPQKTNAAPFRADDRLILLEAAAEIRYLFDGQEGGGPLKLSPALADGHPRTTLTSSSRDTAVSAAVWGWYAGDADTFNELCRNNASTWGHKGFRSVLPVNRYELDLTEVQCAALWRNPGGYGNNVCPLDQDDPGREQPDPVVAARAFEPGKPSKHPLRYVDASSVINCPAPTSAGGAHGDIYRRETARFILDELR